MNFIDLFAGAGGLSEGFVRESFRPAAHVEMDNDACNTLKTRLAFHHLNSLKRSDTYIAYLKNKITRDELWNAIPAHLLASVINSEISGKTINSIFNQVD